MAGNGFNPLKPPMPPGVNRLGLPSFGPQPPGLGGGGHGQSGPTGYPQGFTPGGQHRFADPSGPADGNNGIAKYGGAPTMSPQQPNQLANALMQRMGGASIAPGGSMAQFGHPQNPGIPQPGMGGQPMQLGAQPMGGPMGVGQAQMPGAPNWLNDTYMHMPRTIPSGNT